MSQISLRSVPQEILKIINTKAKKLQKTKTEIVIEALRQAFGLTKKKSTIQRDVRSFFGKMTSDEFKEMQKTTKPFSSIDEEMWK